MADEKKKPKPKDEEKPKDQKKDKPKEEKKPKEEEKKEYDPNIGAVKGTEIDVETGKALDPHAAAKASGGQDPNEVQKEAHRHDDDRVPHPLKHEEVGSSQPVVDGTVTAAGGAPGQPSEPTVPGQDQQVPSQPKVVDALGGGVPVQPDAGVTGRVGVKKSPGESGPTGKLPIA